MVYQKIAIAGATGNLGPTIVQALIDAGFDVTILSSSGNTSGLPVAAKTVKVDYSSQDSLVNALKGQDVFISAIPQHDTQPALIDAAITLDAQLDRGPAVDRAPHTPPPVRGLAVPTAAAGGGIRASRGPATQFSPG